jgi:hypothetical protein
MPLEFVDPLGLGRGGINPEKSTGMICGSGWSLTLAPEPEAGVMKRIFLASVLALSTGVTLDADDLFDSPRISLVAAKTIPAVLGRFKRDQPKADPARFSVYVREGKDSVELIFVPESTPMTRECDKDDCAYSMASGGVTLHGVGITYIVDKRNYEILKTVWAR